MVAEPVSVSDLILGRLVSAFDDGLPEEQLRRELFPFVAHELSEEQWETRLRALLEALGRETLVRPGRRGTSLTRRGQLRACEFIGLDDVPAAARWDALFQTWIVPRAIGRAGEGDLRSADALRIAILQQRYSLSLPEGASLRETRDALAWREIGFDRHDAFTAGAVLSAVLSRAGNPLLADAGGCGTVARGPRRGRRWNRCPRAADSRRAPRHRLRRPAARTRLRRRLEMKIARV